MVPVISGKVEERQQRFAILDQAFDRLVVFRRVFLGECRDRRLRCCSIRRQPDFAQVFVRVGLHGLWKLVENVQRLVQPAALVTRRREGLVESFPEAERAIADGDFRCDRQAARLQIDEQFLPTLCALPHAGPETDQLLLALGRRANQHQHAFGLWLHPRLQIDTVRPHVNVAACRQIALLPPLILVFPLALEPGDHRRREVRRVLAEQGRENLLKIARRNPAQIESRQERVEALRSSRPFRQDRRGDPSQTTRSVKCRKPGARSIVEQLKHFRFRANVPERFARHVRKSFLA